RRYHPIAHVMSPVRSWQQCYCLYCLGSSEASERQRVRFRRYLSRAGTITTIGNHAAFRFLVAFFCSYFAFCWSISFLGTAINRRVKSSKRRNSSDGADALGFVFFIVFLEFRE